MATSKNVSDQCDLSQNLSELQTDDFFSDKDEENRFLEWFWKGTNGNNLIKKLNGCPVAKRYEDSIRREKESPAIYVLVLNDGEFPFKHEGEQWKLCKVGFTHCTTKQGKNNRMEQVKKKIISKYKKPQGPDAKASVLFVLPIGAVDTTPFIQTEKRIQMKVGKPVRKDKAKEIGLPFPTEWVLTTQKRIDDIKDKIDKKVEENKGSNVIDIFKELKDAPNPPAEYVDDWCETD